MKTITNSLSMVMLVMLASATLSLAQGKGHGHGKGNPGKGHDKENPGRGHDKDRDHHGRDRDHRDDYHNDRDRNYSYSSRNTTWYYPGDRYVAYHHYRSGPPSWAPAYGYRYNTRYIYYRDYNVYYDCDRDVFVTWTGGRWLVSTRIPSILIGVNFNNCVVSGVDYWDDDFDYYLNRKRPVHVSILASW